MNKLSEDDIKAVADLSKISLTNTVEVIISSINKDLDIKIVNPIRLINITVENIINVQFPVLISANGKPEKGYAVANTKAEPEKITIKRFRKCN